MGGSAAELLSNSCTTQANGIVLSEHMDGPAKPKMFEHACAIGLEASGQDAKMRPTGYVGNTSNSIRSGTVRSSAMLSGLRAMLRPGRGLPLPPGPRLGGVFVAACWAAWNGQLFTTNRATWTLAGKISPVFGAFLFGTHLRQHSVARVIASICL
jgi:hypothetical protein